MRRGCVVLVVAMVFIFLCTGISFSQAKKVTIKFSSPFMADDHRTRIYQYWADLVNKGTSGRVEVVIFAGGSLVPLKDHYHSIAGGSIGGGELVSSMLADSIPEIIPATMEGHMPIHEPEDLITAEKLLNPVLVKIHEKYNMRYLFNTYQGKMCFTIRKDKKQIMKVEDLRGLKIRTLGYSAKVLSSLGASPIIVELSQVIPGLHYGTFDGALWNDTTAQSIKADEVAPYLTYPGSDYGTLVYAAMNLDMFKAISKADQQILIQASEKATEYSATVSKKQRDDFLANPRGFKIYNFSKEEAQKYKQAISVVAKEVFKTLPPLGKELVDLLEKGQK
jgi:TRAP-type transport system periplasmic protein